MKTILLESSIRLEPETFGDQLYIAHFIKEVSSADLTENIEAEFKYSEDRMSEDSPKGGGWLDPERIVASLYEAERDEADKKVAIEEITALEILTYQL